MAHDRKTRRQGLRAVEPPRLAVVDRVGGDEVGEEALAAAANLAEGDFVEARPGALDDGGAELFEEGSVGLGDGAFAVGAGGRGLMVAFYGEGEGEAMGAYVMITPLNLRPMGRSRMRPCRISFLPEHLSGSQWPRSHAAAISYTLYQHISLFLLLFLSF